MELGELYINKIYLKKLYGANEESHSKISGGVSEIPIEMENLTLNTSLDIKEDLGYWEADGCSHSSLDHLTLQCLNITEVPQTGMKAKSTLFPTLVSHFEIWRIPFCLFPLVVFRNADEGK